MPFKSYASAPIKRKSQGSGSSRKDSPDDGEFFLALASRTGCRGTARAARPLGRMMDIRISLPSRAGICAAAALLAVVTAAVPGSPAGTVPARADAFVSAIGVDSHFSYRSGPEYLDYATQRDELVASGIRHCATAPRRAIANISLSCATSASTASRTRSASP